MRTFTKILTATLAAATLAGSFAVATEANAQSRRYYGGRYYDRHDRTGAAVAAGIAGLALGAALSDRGRGYSYGYGYGPSYGYYDGGYYAPRYYGGYYEPRGYYGVPRYYGRGRACTFWEHDRWGRAYRVRGWC